MLPFLPLHTLAARRGDGLRPELLALFLRHAPQEPGLSAGIEADAGDRATNASATAPEHDSPEAIREE